MKSLVSPGEQKTQDVLKKADDFIEKVNKVKTTKKHPSRDNTGGLCQLVCWCVIEMKT